MLWAIAVVVLGLLGVVTSSTIDGFIRILLVVAIIAVLVRVIQGRRPSERAGVRAAAPVRSPALRAWGPQSRLRPRACPPSDGCGGEQVRARGSAVRVVRAQPDSVSGRVDWSGGLEATLNRALRARPGNVALQDVAIMVE